MSEPAQRAAADVAVSSFAEHVAAIRERSEHARAALRDARGTATSPDGAVTVTVESSGALADLRLAPSASTHDPDALARLVLSTSRQARRAMLHEAERAVAGISDAALEVLRGQLADLGPAPATDITPPPFVATDQQADETIDDDGGFAGRGR